MISTEISRVPCIRRGRTGDAGTYIYRNPLKTAIIKTAKEMLGL